MTPGKLYKTKDDIEFVFNYKYCLMLENSIFVLINITPLQWSDCLVRIYILYNKKLYNRVVQKKYLTVYFQKVCSILKTETETETETETGTKTIPISLDLN